MHVQALFLGKAAGQTLGLDSDGRFRVGREFFERATTATAYIHQVFIAHEILEHIFASAVVDLCLERGGLHRVRIVIGEHFLFLVVAYLHVIRPAQQNGAAFIAAQNGDVVAVTDAVENLHERIWRAQVELNQKVFDSVFCHKSTRRGGSSSSWVITLAGGRVKCEVGPCTAINGPLKASAAS